jgi:hypothetical protein
MLHEDAWAMGRAFNGAKAHVEVPQCTRLLNYDAFKPLLPLLGSSAGLLVLRLIPAALSKHFQKTLNADLISPR